MNQFLIVGAGKLAKHLNHYLTLLRLSPLSWDRSQDPHLLKSKLEESTHVLLAISDSAIEGFYATKLAGLGKTVVHFSGASHFDEVPAAHPLMTFGPELYDLETYRKIHFVVSGATGLADLLPGVPNSSSVLPPEKKPLYHALCVMGGNFPVILWRKMLSELEALGVSKEQAAPYLQQCLHNTLQNPQTALTGPLARRDVGTLRKNLQALQDDPFQKIYLSFIEASAPDVYEAVASRRNL